MIKFLSIILGIVIWVDCSAVKQPPVKTIIGTWQGELKSESTTDGVRTDHSIFCRMTFTPELTVRIEEDLNGTPSENIVFFLNYAVLGDGTIRISDGGEMFLVQQLDNGELVVGSAPENRRNESAPVYVQVRYRRPD